MKVKDGIIGLLIGDVLGVPVEFCSRSELEKNPITGITGYWVHNQPPGTWSDDTSMTLATMSSIINKNNIDYDDIMKEFQEWLFNTKYTQYGETFDSGITTAAAIDKYAAGTPALECGGKNERNNRNGSLMRILPLAFIGDVDFKIIENLSALTHAHERSQISCVLYVQIAKSMINNKGLTIKKHVENASGEIIKHYADSPELKHFERIFNYDFSDGVLSSGYVINSFESALYCLKTTDNYKDAVLKAVNLGKDTDTNAAICGGLAGIYYGFDDIPADWINSVPKIDRVLSLCEKYESIL